MQQCHINAYGYSADYLNNIVKDYSFKDLQRVLIKDKKLTQAQALNTWDWFCNPKWCQGKKKAAGRQSIIQEYNQREQTKINQQKEVQAQQKKVALEQQQRSTLRLNTQKESVEKFLTESGLDPGQSVYLPQDLNILQDQYQYSAQLCKEMLQHDHSPIWSERLHALQKTEDQNFAQSAQEITLSPQTSGYLLANDLQPNLYQSWYGTALQQQLHRELCCNFELIAQTQQNFAHQSSFLHAATQCTDAAYWSNQFESMPLTMHLIDLGKACYKVGEWTLQNGPLYAQALVDGVAESAWDFVHMVCHPVELAENLSQAAWFVCDTMALADQDSFGATLPIAKQQLQERANTVSSVALILHDNVKKSTGPQRVKMTTKFTADCIFMHKATQAVGAAAGILQTQARTMRTVEYAAEIMGHEPAFATASESIAQATQELETTLQKSISQELAPLSESLEKAGIAAIESKALTRSIAEVLSDIQKLGGKIPLSNTELCKEVKILVEKLVKEANIAIDTKLHQQFSSKWITENGLKKRVTIDFEHVLNYSVEIIEDSIKRSLDIKLKGGHFTGSTESLANKGLIKITKRKLLDNGCTKYDFIDVFTGNPFEKTEFPMNWDHEKIIHNCFKVYENPEGILSSVRGNKISKVLSVDGVEIKIIIKPHDKCANIITAYPIA